MRAFRVARTAERRARMRGGLEVSVDKNLIEGVLIREYGYAPRSAELTAYDLTHFSASIHDDLDEAVSRWARNRLDKVDIHAGVHSARSLMAHGLAYPAALVFLDWYRTDPTTASLALDAGMWQR